MNHPIAQAVALTCYGNAVLRGLDPPSFFPGNSTCKFCDQIKFVESKLTLSPKGKIATVAETVDDWLKMLRQNGARGIQLKYQRPSFINAVKTAIISCPAGKQWQLAVVASSGLQATAWTGHWQVWNQQAPEQRIWRVSYQNIGRTKVIPVDAIKLKPISETLIALTAELADFASNNNCQNFAKCFSDAHLQLKNGQIDDIYHQDLAPAGVLIPEAMTLLAACQKAWVFGGMGSWNDLAFAGREQIRYQDLTQRLFDTLNSAITIATNCSLII